MEMHDGIRAIEVTFGALADPIANQLAAYALVDTKIKLHQRQADAICTLNVGGLLSGSAAQRMRQRLLKTIVATTIRRF